MQTSESGISLIKAFEGIRLSAYQDSVGVWTIGYGHTHGVYPGMVITAAQAEDFLRADLASFESYVAAVVKVPYSTRMNDALVSFTYNCGQGNLAKSSLLRLLNIGDYQSAADGFLLWNRAGGVVVAGLTKRREMERALFLQGVADLQNASPAPSDTSDATSDTSVSPDSTSSAAPTDGSDGSSDSSDNTNSMN